MTRHDNMGMFVYILKYIKEIIYVEWKEIILILLVKQFMRMGPSTCRFKLAINDESKLSKNKIQDGNFPACRIRFYDIKSKNYKYTYKIQTSSLIVQNILNLCSTCIKGFVLTCYKPIFSTLELPVWAGSGFERRILSLAQLSKVEYRYTYSRLFERKMNLYNI